MHLHCNQQLHESHKTYRGSELCYLIQNENVQNGVKAALTCSMEVHLLLQ